MCGLLAFINVHLHSQAISISVTVNPPYDPDFYSYSTDPSRVLITITNMSGTTQSIKLGATFRAIDGSKSISTSPDFQPSQPIDMMAGQTRLLTTDDLQALFPSLSSVSLVGVERSELERSGRLPAGIYQLCVTAYQYSAPGHSVPVSAVIPSGCSAPFRVSILNAPEITAFGATSCGETMEVMDIQNFVMLWNGPPEAPTNLRYVIEMIELMPIDRNPMEAFEAATSPIFFTDSVTNLTSYAYTAANPRLEAGRKYAVRIRAVDPAGALRTF